MPTALSNPNSSIFALSPESKAHSTGYAPYQLSVQKKIQENASLSVTYLVMNALATIIACYGLLADNAAVVIGAMIIAMLLDPIPGIALGLTNGDNRLLLKALLTETVGVLIVLIIAFIIGKIHYDIPLAKEISARTSPNLFDLIIALASGAAGAYAIVSPRLSVNIVALWECRGMNYV